LEYFGSIPAGNCTAGRPALKITLVFPLPVAVQYEAWAGGKSQCMTIGRPSYAWTVKTG
jgi:hypothetical protein